MERVGETEVGTEMAIWGDPSPKLLPFQPPPQSLLSDSFLCPPLVFIGVLHGTTRRSSLTANQASSLVPAEGPFTCSEEAEGEYPWCSHHVDSPTGRS
jgi:hypothetical protein